MTSKQTKRSKWIGQEAVNIALKPARTSIISLYVIRFYDLSIWGEIISFLLTVELATIIINWGQKSYLLKRFSEDISRIPEVWIGAIYARIPLFLLALLFIVLTPHFKGITIPLVGWILFKWAVQMFDAYVQFNRKYNWSIASEVVGITLSLVCLFFSKTMYLNQLTWVFCFSFLGQLFVLLPLLPLKKTFQVNPFNGAKSLKQSFPFLLLSLVGLAQTKGDLYVSTYFLSVDELAIYQVIIGFLLLGQSLSWVILSPFQKNILRWHHKSITKIKESYFKIGLIVSITTVIIIYLVLQYIYRITIENNLIIFFLSYLVIMYFYLIESQILIKKGRENALLRFSLYGGIMNVALSYITIPFWGIQGALLGGIMGKIVLAISVVRKSKRI